VEPICLDLINQSWGLKVQSIKGFTELQVSGLGPLGVCSMSTFLCMLLQSIGHLELVDMFIFCNYCCTRDCLCSQIY
jgi:hypothetical protein